MNSNEVVWSPGVPLERLEKQVILKAYKHYRESKKVTAEALGISVRTLDNKFEKYAEEQKIQEAKDADRKRKREEFLKRCRGINPAEPSKANAPLQSTPEYGMESSFGAANDDALPMQESVDVQTMLPAQTTSLRSKKSR